MRTFNFRHRQLSAWVVLAGIAVAGCTAPPVTSPEAASSGGMSSASSASPAPSESETSPEPFSASAGQGCRQLAEGLSPQQQAGQLFMVGVETSGLSNAARRVIGDGAAGSVVLLGNSEAGSTHIAALSAEIAAAAPEGMPVLVAVDQEGGKVTRLRGPGFSEIPTAVEQGKLADGELRARAGVWGKELRDAGVHVDLAPVADVVPPEKTDSNAPIGKLRRNFGTDPGQVSRSVVEFTEGMQEAGVLTSLKHFPGLGEVSVNTDFGQAEDSDITADHEALEPFRAGIGAGADSVMISSAVFTLIDPEQEGVFSPAIVTTLLREQLGFEGVAISDDLGAAVSVGGVSPGQRAVRFFAAGGDLLINADPALMDEMLQATTTWAAESPENTARLAESAGRVLELKEKAGLLSCG